MKAFAFYTAGLFLLTLIVFMGGRSMLRPSSQDVDIIIGEHESLENQDYILSAGHYLFQSCAGLMSYKEDIVSVQGSYENPAIYDYHNEKLGWKKMVRFEVYIKDDPQEIPSKYRAGGHMLYYAVSPTNGITMSKPVSAYVCFDSYVASKCEADLLLQADGMVKDIFCDP